MSQPRPSLRKYSRAQLRRSQDMLDRQRLATSPGMLRSVTTRGTTQRSIARPRATGGGSGAYYA